MKDKVMGLDQLENERDRLYLACSPIGAHKTAVLIDIRSANIHQHDSSYLLVLNVPSSLAPGRTHVYRTSH